MISSNALAELVQKPGQEKGRDLESLNDKMIVEGLSAGFGSNKVLDNITLGFKQNTVTAIIGPSGCGKSTFIRCLNRMHEVTPDAWASGRVMLDGEDILSAGMDPASIRRRVGMVFQRPNPFPTMSVFDNVAAGLRLNGMKNHGMTSAWNPDLYVCNTSTGITATSCGTAISLTTNAPAVIYSIGKNGASGGSGNDERENPNPNSANNDRFFVYHEPTSFGAANGEFDDQMIWLSNAVLLSRMVAAGQLP